MACTLSTATMPCRFMRTRSFSLAVSWLEGTENGPICTATPHSSLSYNTAAMQPEQQQALMARHPMCLRSNTSACSLHAPHLVLAQLLIGVPVDSSDAEGRGSQECEHLGCRDGGVTLKQPLAGGLAVLLPVKLQQGVDSNCESEWNTGVQDIACKGKDITKRVRGTRRIKEHKSAQSAHGRAAWRSKLHPYVSMPGVVYKCELNCVQLCSNVYNQRSCHSLHIRPYSHISDSVMPFHSFHSFHSHPRGRGRRRSPQSRAPTHHRGAARGCSDWCEQITELGLMGCTATEG